MVFCTTSNSSGSVKSCSATLKKNNVNTVLNAVISIPDGASFVDRECEVVSDVFLDADDSISVYMSNTSNVASYNCSVVLEGIYLE